MKKRILWTVLTVALLVGIGVGVFLTLQYRENQAWEGIKQTNNIEELKKFLAKFPKSVHSAEANGKLKLLLSDKEAWEIANEIHSVKAMSDFMTKFPKSVHFEDAHKMIKSIQQEELAGLNNAILLMINEKPSSLKKTPSLNSDNVSVRLLNGTVTLYESGNVIDPGGKVVYDFNYGDIKVFGTMGIAYNIGHPDTGEINFSKTKKTELVSIEEVIIAKGVEIGFKNGDYYIYNGNEWAYKPHEDDK